MPFVLLAVLGVVALLGLGALGVYALARLPGLLWRSLPAPPPSPALPEPEPPADDLHRYPRELELLEGQLLGSLDAVRTQREHLSERKAELARKEGRDELAARYAEDLTLLTRREAGMRRVLGMVWKARALLTLRAHLAETARGRPDLPTLPPVDEPGTDLDRAAGLYGQSAARVRAFLSRVDARAADLARAVPAAPIAAEIGRETRDEVERELSRIQAAYDAQREALDRLADTLAYLADRCRTRRVVQGASPALAEAAGGGALLAEVEAALGQLQELAEAGDRKLADLAVKNLAEDISQLERAGLEAQAEAEAAIEVARLLEQF